MDSGDRAGVSIALIVASALVAMCFLLSTCDARQAEYRYKMDQTVRTECIRAGGDWGVVSKPTDATVYGCVKGK